jgi:hypothetical protein
MLPPLHQRLLNEATQHGTAEVLRQSPAEYSPELEQAIRHGVRQAVQYYAGSLDTLSRQRVRSANSVLDSRSRGILTREAKAALERLERRSVSQEMGKFARRVGHFWAQ